MIVDIVDKYCTDDNNPIKNLRLKNTPNLKVAKVGKIAMNVFFRENCVYIFGHRTVNFKYVALCFFSQKLYP